MTRVSFISCFGSFGDREGEFNYPWGIDLDQSENIYVADWRNNRIQIFDKNGNFLESISKYNDNYL